jgi:plastocyanin
MKMRLRVMLLVVALAFANLLPTSALSQPAQETGSVEGVLKYRADAKRPWKFARYYVANPKDDHLAEAVVALEGNNLSRSILQTPKTRTIDQVNYQFVPETMAVRVGDAVRISNSDEALHNVMTSDGGEPFNVNVAKGKDFTHTFDRAGGLKEPVRLGCVFHGGMRAWIYVFDHPWFKVTERDGQFRFENVPAGEYELGIIHPAGKLRQTKRIVVKPNEKTFMEITLSPDDLIGVKNEGK